MMHDQHAMAEMAGGLGEFQADAIHTASGHGIDASAVVAAELAAEGHWVPADGHPAPAVVPAGLAALEAETAE